MRIFKNAWFVRFARRQAIADETLKDAIARAEVGRVDADLGGGVLKLRIARTGEGRSGGFRTVVLYRRAEKAFFVYGFAKSDQANIEPDEVTAFKRAARHVLALSDQQLRELVAKREFSEVE